MDCATCVSSGGKSIGANCNPNLAGFCCCKVYSDIYHYFKDQDFKKP